MANTSVLRSRSDLAGSSATRSTRGVLLVPAGAELAIGLTVDEMLEVRRRTATTLAAAGVTAADRVVVALNDDGELGGILTALAVADLGATVCSVGPRGRMRLLRTIERVRPTTLVVTPTGAADLLARLHLEFLVDPLELGLERLVLVGEIAPASAYHHLATEFGADTIEVYAEPFSSAVLAFRRIDERTFRVVHDEILEPRPVRAVDGSDDDLEELLLHAPWLSQVDGAPLRTGQVVRRLDGTTELPLVEHTIGEHLLIRGRWISLPALERELRAIDGLAHWTLSVDRKGTLDAATLHAVFDRENLVSNPMWLGRVREALRVASPIEVTVEAHATGEWTNPADHDDRRGHHLGRRDPATVE